MFKWTSKGSLSPYSPDDSLGDAKVISKSRHTPESPYDRRRSKIDSHESSAVNERETRSHSKPKRQRDRSAPSRPENTVDSDGKDANSRKGNLLNKFKKIFQRSSSKSRGSKSAPSSPTSNSRFDRTASLVDGRPPSNVPKAKRSRSRLEKLIDAKKDYRRLGQSKVTPSFSDVADDESDSTACYRTNAERHCDRPTHLNLSYANYENGIQDKQKYGEGEAAYLTGTPPSGKWSSFLVKNTQDGSDFKAKRLAQNAKKASTLSDTCILTFRDRQSVDDTDSSQTSIISPDPDDHGPVVMDIEGRETLPRQSDNVMLKNKMFGLSPSAYSDNSSRCLQNWMDKVKTIDPFVLCQVKKSLKKVNTYMPEGETKKMRETCRRLTFSHNKDGGLSVSPKSSNSPRNLRPAKQTTCADKTAQAGTKNNNNGHNSLHTRNDIDILSPESFPKNGAHGVNEHPSRRPYSQFMFNESVSFSRTPFYNKTRFQDSHQCSKVQRIVHSLEEKLATPLNTTPPTVHANPNFDSNASLGLPTKDTVSHVDNCNQRVPTLTSLCQLKNAGQAACLSEPSPSISSRTTSRSSESSQSKGFRPSYLPLVDYLNDNTNERSGSESGSGQVKRHQVKKSYGDEARRVTSKLSLYLSPTTSNMKSVEVIDKTSPLTVSLSEQISDKMLCSDTSETAEASYALVVSNSLETTDRVGLSDTADTSDIAGISTFMDVLDKTDVSDIINVSGIGKVSENVPAEEYASDTTDIAYMSDVMNVSDIDIDSVDQDMHYDGSVLADEDMSKSSIIWNGEYTDYDEVVCAGDCLEDKTHNDLADDCCHGKSSNFGNTSDCSGKFGVVYNRDEPCHVFSRDKEYAEHAGNALRYTDSDILEGLVEEDSCEEKTLSSFDLQTPEPSLSVGKGNSEWRDENAARPIRLERHDSPYCDEKAHDVILEQDLSEMSDKAPLELLELNEKEIPGLGGAFCNSTTLKMPLDSSMAYSQEVGEGSPTSQMMEQEEMIEAAQGSEKENDMASSRGSDGVSIKHEDPDETRLDMEQEEMIEAAQGSEKENDVASSRGSDGVSIKHEDPDETRLDMEQESSISKKDEKLTVSNFTTTDNCDVAARRLNVAYDTRNDLTSCIGQTNSREIKKERCEGDQILDELEEEKQEKFKTNEEEERQEEFRMKEEWSDSTDRCQRNERDRDNEQMSEKRKEEDPNSVRSNEDLRQLGHHYTEMSKSWKSEEQRISQMREAENGEDQKTKRYWNNGDHSSSLAKEGCIEEMRTKGERSLGGHRCYKMTEMGFEQPVSKKSQRESSSRVEWVQASNSSEDKAIVDLSCLSLDSPTSKDHQTVGASTSLSDSIYDMDWSVFSQEPRLGNTPCQRSSNSQVEASPTAGQGQVQGQSKPDEGDASSGQSHDFPFETTCSSGNMKEMDVEADSKEADGAIIVKYATDPVSLNTTSLSVKGRGSCVNFRGEVSATRLKSNISNVEPMPDGRLVEKQEDYCDGVVRVKEGHADETERIISADIKEGSDNDLRGEVAKDDIQNNDASMAKENAVESEGNRMCIDGMGESNLNYYGDEIRIDGKDDLMELKFGIDGLEKRKHVEWVDGIKSDYTNLNVKENYDASNNVYKNEADSRFNVTLTDDGNVDICANEIGGGLLEWVFSDQGTQPNRELIPGDEIDEDETYNSGDYEEEDQIDSPVDVNFEESWVPGDVGEVSTVKCATSDDQMSWEVGSHNISLTWKDTTAGDIEETALRDALSVEDPRLTHALSLEDPRLTHALPLEDPRLTHALPLEDPRLTQDLHELSLDSATRCIADYYRSLSHLEPGEAMMSKFSDDTYNDLTMDSYANASLFSELHDDGSGDQSKSQEDTERHESEKKFLEGLPTTRADDVHKQRTASGSSSQVSIATKTWTIDNMESWRQRRLEDMTYKRNSKWNRRVKVIVNEIGRRVKVKRSNSGNGERNVRRENAQNRPLMNLMSSTTKRYAQKGMGSRVEPERDSDGMGEVVKHKRVTAGIPKRYRKREVSKRQEATRIVCEMKELSPKYYRYNHRHVRPGPESDYSKYEMEQIVKAKQHTDVPSRYPHSHRGENTIAESTHSMHEVGQTVEADCKQGSTGKAKVKWSHQDGDCYIPKQWLFLSTMFFFQFVIHWLYAR